jgi:nucleoid-associated protein EbfC
MIGSSGELVRNSKAYASRASLARKTIEKTAARIVKNRKDVRREAVIQYPERTFCRFCEDNMKLPGGMDLESMMRQAQEMQEKMGREMKEMTVEAAAGGGAVTVKMRGDFEVVSLTISPDLVKDGDVEMLQDLTVAALNEARRKVEESLKGKLGGMLPPGLM